VTGQFASNQAKYGSGSGKRSTQLSDGQRSQSFTSTSSPYFINNGKIVTELVGTPIETPFSRWATRFGARSNDWLCQLPPPAVAELAPLMGPVKAPVK
jgi:hypothetical protein